MSSTRVVTLSAAQASRSAMLMPSILPDLRTASDIPVTLASCSGIEVLAPMMPHCCPTKMTSDGAMSSCKVHPRLNHTENPRADGSSLTLCSSTSSRYAMQTADFLYHGYIEFSDSVSSALLALSMQQVSIQIHSQPNDAANSHALSSFAHPFRAVLSGRSRSGRVISSSRHLCERIAYGGGSVWKNSSRWVLVERRRMLDNEEDHHGAVVWFYTVHTCR